MRFDETNLNDEVLVIDPAQAALFEDDRMVPVDDSIQNRLFDDIQLQNNPAHNMLKGMELTAQAADKFKASKTAEATGDLLAVLDLLAEAKRLYEAGRALILGLQRSTNAPDAIQSEQPEARVKDVIDTQAENTHRVVYGLPEGAFEYDAGKVTPTKRQKRNDEAVELLRRLQAGELAQSALTDEQKLTLSLYSGNGGNLQRDDGMSGSQYEYYTPKPIASGMWALLKASGFTNGAVLDPCAGTGVFSATAPQDVAIQSVELDAVSGGINAALFASDTNKVAVSSFEKVATATDDELYDAVITNVPFGDSLARGAHRFDDPRYQNEGLEGYFILRSLDKLKPNGVAVFMSGTGFISGTSKEKLRLSASLKAEFMGAYRLPNQLFDSAGADVTTDVMVFKKHSRQALDKIDELMASSPDVLRTANVLWSEFIEGQYFKGEGLRYVLGTTQTGKNRYGKEVERVVSEHTTADIAKMMTKLGGSRIDWAALEAAEGEPMVYKDGDCLTLGGEVLQYQGGTWAKVEADTAQVALFERVASYRSAVTVVEDELPFMPMRDAWLAAKRVGDYTSIHDWVRPLMRYLDSSQLLDSDTDWWALVSAMALYRVKEAHAGQEQVNYLSQYPKLSERIKGYCRKKPVLQNNIPQFLKETVKSMCGTLVYDKKARQFTPFWRGEVGTMMAKTLTNLQRYEALLYRDSGARSEVMNVTLDDFKAEFPDVDVYTDPNWCLSNGGTHVMVAGDYYHGAYAGLKSKLAEGIAQCTDDKLRAKLMAQALEAENRVQRVDVKNMTFDLLSSFISNDVKLEFLRTYVSSEFTCRDGKFECKGATKSENGRNLRRLANYLNTEGSFTTGTANKEDDPELEAERLKRLKEVVKVANLQLDAYVKSNKYVLAEVESALNADDALRFVETEDGDPLEIAGTNTAFTPHSYQNAFIRSQARHMGGICGFDVGLGKTATGLLTVQHLHNIGVKQKTVFVVPNTTLTNWKKEAASIYTNVDDCLFVGLSVKPDGTSEVKASQFAKDLNLILENRHSKIFMTLEAFEKIPLTQNTLNEYSVHLSLYEPYYGGTSSKTSDYEAGQGRLAGLAQVIAKSMDVSVPYLENMGVDSVVMDEAHVYKNSKPSKGSRDIAWLPTPQTSARGLNAQAKAWYIRQRNAPKADGVLALSATPITNSPLEIYSMLSLAMGEKELSRSLAGCSGADDFIQNFCDVDFRMLPSVTGEEREAKVFAGIKNVALLRKIFKSVATIKTADDVDFLKLPEGVDVAQNVVLSPTTNDAIRHLKQGYSLARKRIAKQPMTEAEDNALNAMLVRGNTVALLAHPFNFINKVSKTILDTELADQSTQYTVADNQLEAAQKAVAQFNAKAIKEERDRPSPYTTDEAILKSRVEENKQTGELKEILTVQVLATLDKDHIVIDTESFKTQSQFIKIAEKLGVHLDVSIPPKIAALLENVKAERANPKSKGGRAKQIIFCDMLGMHHKIKYALINQAGVDAPKISIINAEAISDAGQLQDIQDGFNGDEADNRFEIIIANKKAEVGINLQKGTQAIHHLTVGWTPDSLQQRNGRGKRQGNYVEMVRIYHYDANGTFDSYKRTLVNSKSNWIGELVNGTGERVAIESGMSREDQELLASMVGDAEALAKAVENIAARNKLREQDTARETLFSTLKVIDVQNKSLQKIEAFESYCIPLFDKTWVAYSALLRATERVGILKDKAEPLSDDEQVLQAKREATLASQQAVYNKLSQVLEPSIGSFVTWQGQYLSQYTKSSGGSSSRDVRAYFNTLSNEQKQALPLYADWQDDVQAMTAMIADMQSKADDLESQSGFAEGALAAVKAGEAIVVNNTIVGKGDIAVIDGTPWLLTSEFGSSFYDRGSKTADALRIETVETPVEPNANVPSIETQRCSDSNLMYKAELITKGSPAYADMLKRMAARDGAYLAANAWQVDAARAERLYYYPSLPELLSLMSQQPQATIQWSNVKIYLAADDTYCYFLPPSAAASPTPLMKAVVQEHATKGFTYVDEVVTVSADAESVTSAYSNANNRVEGLVAFAMRNGIAVAPSDICLVSDDAVSDNLVLQRTNAWLSLMLDTSVVSVAGALEYYQALPDKEGADLVKVFHTYVLQSLMDTKILGEGFVNDTLVARLTDGLPSYDQGRVWLREFMKEAQAIQAQQRAESQASLNTSPENPPPSAAPAGDSGRVAVIGNTYPMKEQLKAIGLARGEPVEFFAADKPVSSRRAWSQKALANYPTNAAVEQLLGVKAAWLTTNSVFEQLLRDYPNECQKYNIVGKAI